MRRIPTTAPQGPGTRRPLRVAVLAVLAGLLAVLVPVATPATASAADGYYGGYGGSYDGGYDNNNNYSGTVYVFPVLNCISAGSNGSYTAVLGYRNTNRYTTFTITGDYNRISPSYYNGGQPTTFKPGTYNGAYSLRVTSGTVYWDLAGTRLTISRTAAAACPNGTQMPADGNGTGVVVALVAAAAIGAVVVHRVRRRATAATPEQTHVDA